MVRLGPPVLVAALLLPLVAVATNEAEAMRWLERMTEAAQRLDYVGTFVYRHGDSMQTMRIAHGRIEGAERERLVTLDGPQREIVRDSDKVACVLADGVLVEPSGRDGALPLFPANRLADLEDHYRFSLGDRSERVAGLPARQVIVQPSDGYRYGYRFWIAEDSALMLQSELVDAAGRVVEELKFTSIAVHDALPPELLQNGTAGIDPRSVPVAPSKAESGGRWSVSPLPPAFAVASHVHHPMAGNRETEHLVLSDGLASVSVFIEHRSGLADAPPDGDSYAVGAVHVLTRIIGDHRLTVVGEVPLVTVRWIADAVNPPKQ